MKHTKPIIIDTDPGTDDAIALAVAAVKMSPDISCLVSTYGNVVGEQTYRNLVDLANLFNINKKIIKGALNPIGKESFVSTDFHGKDGLGGVEIYRISSNHKNPYKNYLKELYETVRQNGKSIYIALGPLTNFALLLTNYPDVVNYIDKLVIMGGGLNVYNVNNIAEYNFSLDPIANKIVLSSSVNIYLATLDLTHTLALSENEIEQIINNFRKNIDDNPIENSAYSIASQILFKNLDSSLNQGHDGAIIHDASTIAFLLNSDYSVVESVSISVNDDGSITYANDGFQVNLIKSMDKDYVSRLLNNVFSYLLKRSVGFEE